MDKRRYLPRENPRRRKPIDMASDVSGDAATDGFSSRYRKPLDRNADYLADSLYRENYACEGLVDDAEARFRQLYGED